MLYFSYGSNMSVRRLLERVPSARKVATGFLEKHTLRFHKVGHHDGSGKGDACESGNPDHLVHGVLFSIAKNEKPGLDRIEGLGHGYEIKDVSIKLRDGTVFDAFMYYATQTDPDLKPYCWYMEHVLIGARENKLPEDYIQQIAEVEYFRDINVQRRNSELSIYL